MRPTEVTQPHSCTATFTGFDRGAGWGVCPASPLYCRAFSRALA